jgi:Fe-S cluster biogenesis protein NfuA
MLSMDGGSIDLVEVNNDGVVKVRLTGACCGCPGAQMTLSGIVESTIKSNVPGVSRVEMV